MYHIIAPTTGKMNSHQPRHAESPTGCPRVLRCVKVWSHPWIGWLAECRVVERVMPDHL
jgi:hypothetical protein